MFIIFTDPEDPDSSKVYSGKTKAYSEPDRKRVKVRVAPLGPFPEGRIRGAQRPGFPGAAFRVTVRKWVKLSEFQQTLALPDLTEFGVPSRGASATPPNSVRLTAETLLVPKTLSWTSPSAPDFPSRHKLPASCAALRHHLRPLSCSSAQAEKVSTASNNRQKYVLVPDIIMMYSKISVSPAFAGIQELVSC